VPPTQALSIFQIFIDCISQSIIAEQATKKRKTSSTQNASQQRSNRLELELLCRFLLSIRLTPQQKSAFSDSLSEVANKFIIERLNIDNNIDNIRLAIPALHLHQALLSTFSDIYFNLLNDDVKNKLSSHLHQIITISSRHSSNLSLTALLYSVSEYYGSFGILSDCYSNIFIRSIPVCNICIIAC
jgi:hypothetical protein